MKANLKVVPDKAPPAPDGGKKFPVWYITKTLKVAQDWAYHEEGWPPGGAVCDKLGQIILGADTRVFTTRAKAARMCVILLDSQIGQLQARRNALHAELGESHAD